MIVYRSIATAKLVRTYSEPRLLRLHLRSINLLLIDAAKSLKEVIAKLDREILTQRKQRLGKALEQGKG
jgi:hypothetical protein